MISDGAGGWYVVGDFNSVGGVTRRRVARILSNGQLDGTFNPDCGPVLSGGVSALALSAGTLYNGGSFLSNANSFGAPLDATTANSNFPQAQIQEDVSTPFNAAIRASVSDGAGGWFVGGDFTTVQGAAIQRLARLNANGTVDVTFNVPIDGTVNSLKLSSGVLYVGGTFTTVGGQDRFNMAAIHDATATVTAWAPQPSSTVNAIETSGGGDILIGGSFTAVASSELFPVADL